MHSVNTHNVIHAQLNWHQLVHVHCRRYQLQLDPLQVVLQAESYITDCMSWLYIIIILVNTHLLSKCASIIITIKNPQVLFPRKFDEIILIGKPFRNTNYITFVGIIIFPCSSWRCLQASFWQTLFFHFNHLTAIAQNCVIVTSYLIQFVEIVHFAEISSWAWAVGRVGKHRRCGVNEL